MEVTSEIFDWLKTYDAEITAESAAEGNLTLDHRSSERLENGLIFPDIIKRLLTLGGNGLLIPQLETLGDSKGSSKVYNWNVVLQAIETLGIQLDVEKELILAGDQEMVVEVLERLYRKETELVTASAPRNFRKPRQAVGGALFIESIDIRRPLSEADTCLEFLLIAFCTHFKLTQKQAAGLLTEGNRYLAFILGKGLRGEFQPVLDMLAGIRSNVDQLGECVLREAKNGSLVLVASALRPGLLSKNESVVQASALLFRDLAKYLNNQKWSLWPWFTGDMGGLDAAVSSLRGCSAQTLKDVTAMLYEVSRGRLDEMIMGLVKNQINDSQLFLQLIAEITQAIAEINGGPETLVNSGILRSLLELCLREGDVETKGGLNLRLSALNLLSFLWRQFHKDIDRNEDLKNSVLSLIKKGCRDRSKLVSGSCITQLFHLLDYFHELKHNSAPVLFKALQLLLIESFHKPDVREFMLENFAMTAEHIPSLPIGQLTEALARQIHMNESMEFNTFDFNFFISISRHPRLEEEHAVQVLDVLGKVYLHQLHYARAAAIPFLLITKRFVASSPLQEYIYRFAKLSVQLVTQSERTKKAPQGSKPSVVLGQPLSLEDLVEETSVLHTRNLVLDLLTKVIRLGSLPLNERLKEVLAMNAVSARAARGDYPRGLLHVLGLLGSPQEILPLYETNNLQLVWKAPDRTPAKPVLAIEDKASSRGAKTILPKLEEKPKKPDRMKQLWEKKAEAEKTGQAVILDRAPVLPPEDPKVEISEEDWVLVRVLLEKYSRLLRQLFKAHAGTGYHKDMANPTFSHLADRREAISEGELLGMLRELGLSKHRLGKEQFLILLKMKSDFGYVDFEGFKEMLALVAVACFDLSHLPAVLSLQCLIDEFRKAAAKAGSDTLLYDEPFLHPGDRHILRQLNRELSRDARTQLPAGYRAVVEKDVRYEYRVPRLGLRESVACALEVLDEVLATSCSMHFLEPLVIVKEVTVATEDAKPLRHSSSFTVMSAANPRLARISSNLKFEAVKLLGSYDNSVLAECALLMEDLLCAVEKKASGLVLGRGRLKAEAQLEAQEALFKLERQKSEQRRKARRQLLNQMSEELAQKKQQSKEQAEAERQQAEYLPRREAKRKQAEAQAERLRREKEEQQRLLAEWRQRKEEQEAQEREAEALKAEAAEKGKRERLAFLKVQRDKVVSRRQASLSALKHSEKEARQKEEAEAAQNYFSDKAQAQKKVADMLELQRLRREQEVQFRTEVGKLVNREDVQALLAEFSGALDTLFSYYAKVSARDPLNATVLLLPGLNKLAQDFKVVPAVLSLQELVQLFRTLTKEKPVESRKPVGLDPLEFRESLLRVVAMKQEALCKVSGAVPPSVLSVESCPIEVVRSLFTLMALPPDARRTGELLKKMSSEPPLHPLEKKKLVKAQ